MLTISKSELSIAGLVLAAGESSRMGRDKALLSYGGRTFLETAVSTLRQAGLAHTVVVLGHHAEEIRRSANLSDAYVVVNPAYRQGQTSSLQAGIHAVVEVGAFQAIVLCLVDHPAVSPEIVSVLVRNFREFRSPVVIPTFERRRGHPVLIARELFGELLELGPEQGADTVIRKYRSATRWVEVNDPGILLDIDDPKSYEILGRFL